MVRGAVQTLTFHPFKRFPPEIRFEIWENSLPPCPTAHFFDVTIHNNEFHICATRERDSGYLPLFAILATCREARAVATAIYRRIEYREMNLTVTNYQWQEQSPAPHHATRPIFKTFEAFDWIPPDDLIILCLPPNLSDSHSLLPRHARSLARNPQLEAGASNGRSPFKWRLNGKRTNAFPFASTLVEGNRHIGLLVPKELLLRGDSHAVVPNFLRGLCESGGGKGLRMVYILLGLRAWPPIFFPHKQDKRSGGGWLGPYLEGNVAWAMGNQGFLMGTTLMWKDMVSLEELQRRQGCSRRQLWWVGSGSVALGLAMPDDSAQRSPFRAMYAFEGRIEEGCRAYWGDRFEGAELLGWMGEELRANNVAKGDGSENDVDWKMPGAF
jgi:2EXR family